MAPPSWATAEQKAFLQGWMAEFIKRQAQGKLHLFWAPLQEAWFKNFPETDFLGLPSSTDRQARPLTPEEMMILGAAIMSRKAKLDNWFRYQKKKLDSKSSAPGGRTASVLTSFLKSKTTKRRRAHQPIELFQKRNGDEIAKALDEAGYNKMNEEKMSEDVDDWEDESKDTKEARVKATKSERMRVRTRVVKALFAEASPEELAEIEAEIEVERAEIRQAELAVEALDASVPQSRTPWELQEFVTGEWTHGFYSDVHATTFNSAGWVGITIAGGPYPRMNGELSVKIISFGESAAGNRFEDACVDFDENVLKSFEIWLRTVYTAAERRSRALPTRPVNHEPRLHNDHPVEVADKPKKPKRMRTKSKKTAKSPTVPSAAMAPPAPVPAATFQASDQTNLTNEARNAEMRNETDVSREPDMQPDMQRVNISDDNATNEQEQPEQQEPEVHDDSHMDSTDDVGAQSNLDADTYTYSPPSPTGPPSTMPWGPPSSPGTAAAAAALERGGLAVGATMAIDPSLESPPTAPPRFVARPAWRNSSFANNPSMNDSAFRPPTPLFRRLGILGVPVGNASTAHASSAVSSAAAVTPLAPSTVVTPTIITPIPASSVVAPEIITPAPASGVVIAPDISLTSDSAAPVKSWSFPESRPPVKSAPEKKKTAAANSASKTKAAQVAASKQKKLTQAAAAKDTADVGAVQRGRGQKRKVVAATNAGDVGGALEDTTNIGNDVNAAPAVPTEPPSLIYTSTNNSRDFAKVVEGRRAAVAAGKAAEKAKKREVEVKEQAKRGWFSSANPDGNTDTVTLTTRSRKPRMLADGTKYAPQVKNVRSKNPHAATEEALLARTGRKRAAEESGVPANTKRRKSAA
ncbi:hypothetical protein C8R43DRAFT_940597 [Mycena crocata]|nr:hypothetical protein C8R43DRAFT_940597 [Mycena crocata]